MENVYGYAHDGSHRTNKRGETGHGQDYIGIAASETRRGLVTAAKYRSICCFVDIQLHHSRRSTNKRVFSYLTPNLLVVGLSRRMYLREARQREVPFGSWGAFSKSLPLELPLHPSANWPEQHVCCDLVSFTGGVGHGAINYFKSRA